MTIRIVLADDEQLVRSGLRLILESEDDLEVAAEAGDGTEAVALVRRLDPDVVLMDVQMPVMNGIEATREIAALGRETSSRVLILTTFDLDEYVYEGLRAGASGFLLKRTPAEELVDAVRVVAAGDALIDPGVTRRLIEHFREREQLRTRRELSTPQGLDDLTEREREVLLLVARGLSNHEIAQQLYLSEGTVKTHVKHVFAKLALRDRAQAVILAYESGLIEPGTAAPGV
ncbi:MAG: response regulator transcription factor [Thermoleophilia bacterium]|nr:response regulator transcription factor [Thermoleophilia bacterium]